MLERLCREMRWFISMDENEGDLAFLWSLTLHYPHYCPVCAKSTLTSCSPCQ